MKSIPDERQPKRKIELHRMLLRLAGRFMQIVYIAGATTNTRANSVAHFRLHPLGSVQKIQRAKHRVSAGASIPNFLPLQLPLKLDPSNAKRRHPKQRLQSRTHTKQLLFPAPYPVDDQGHDMTQQLCVVDS
jgi:hypothetical protein